MSATASFDPTRSITIFAGLSGLDLSTYEPSFVSRPIEIVPPSTTAFLKHVSSDLWRPVFARSVVDSAGASSSPGSLLTAVLSLPVFRDEFCRPYVGHPDFRFFESLRNRTVNWRTYGADIVVINGYIAAPRFQIYRAIKPRR